MARTLSPEETIDAVEPGGAVRAARREGELVKMDGMGRVPVTDRVSGVRTATQTKW